MRFFVPFRPLLIGWAISFAVCAALSVALSLQMSRAVSAPWMDTFRFMGRDWLVWAVVAPLIFRLVDRFPIERSRWKTTVPLHLAAAAVVVLGLGGIAFSLRPGPMKGDKPPEERPAPRRPPAFIEWLLFGPQLPIYLALLSGAHAACFYRRSAERERRSLELTASLAEARLQALRMQIQPHFLFNALNALAALIHRNPDAADEMLASISEFLRMTLANSDGQEVSLERELEYARRYLEIEKVRFGERLSFSIDAEPGTLAARVPSLVLQPLVENSVRHGTEPKADAGSVKVLAHREDESLILSVLDNGEGFPPHFRDGVGLSNTRARLRELYGEDARLQADRVGTRTRVQIRLPFHS